MRFSANDIRNFCETIRTDTNLRYEISDVIPIDEIIYQMVQEMIQTIIDKLVDVENNCRLNNCSFEKINEIISRNVRREVREVIEYINETNQNIH